MPYFSYSPWKDAAAYGKGLGDTLAQAMLQAPQKKEDLLEQRQSFPLQQDLLRARIQEALAQPELRQLLAQASMTRANNQGEHYQNMDRTSQENADTRKNLGEKGLGFKQQALDLAKQRAGTTQDLDKTKMALNEIDAALAQARISKMGQPPIVTPEKKDAAYGRALTAENRIMQSQPANARGPLDLQVAQSASEQASQPGNTNSINDILLKAFSPYSVQPGKKGWFHDDPPITNNASFDVSKIGGSLGRPLPVADQPMANAPEPHFGNQSLPAPDARPVGLKTTTPKGTFQWDGSGWVPVQQ